MAMALAMEVESGVPPMIALKDPSHRVWKVDDDEFRRLKLVSGQVMGNILVLQKLREPLVH